MAFDPIFRWLQDAIIPRNPAFLDFLQSVPCAYADDLAVAVSSFRCLMTALAPAFQKKDQIAGLNLNHRKCCWAQNGSESCLSLLNWVSANYEEFREMKVVKYAKYVGTMMGAEGRAHRWTAPRKNQRVQKINASTESASVEDDTKRVQSALCTKMRIVFHAIRLGPKTSVCREVCHCHVYCIRLRCDHCATTLHGFNKHASSRREAVSDSRGVPRCTEKNFKKSTHVHMCRSFDSSNPSYSYPEISTVIRHHCTIYQVNSSRSAPYPCQALISICGISRVPVLSFQCHLDSHRS